MTILAVLLGTGNPVSLSGVDVMIVRTSICAAFLKSLAVVSKSLSRPIECDTANSSRTMIVMSAIVGLELDIHNPGFHFPRLTMLIQSVQIRKWSLVDLRAE